MIALNEVKGCIIFAHQISNCFVWQKTLRAILVLDVVSTGQANAFGQILELIRKSALLNDAALGHGHLAQRKV